MNWGCPYDPRSELDPDAIYIQIVRPCLVNLPEDFKPNFIWYYLQTREGLEQVQAAPRGSADRNRTLNQKALEAIKVPIPTLDSQQWFDSLHAKATKARNLIGQSAADLDCLLPAMLNQTF